MKVRVKLLPSQKSCDVSQDTNLMDAIHRCGINLRSDCGGNGVCGKCRVRIDNDAADSLACNVLIQRDVTVIIPAASLLHDDLHIVTDSFGFISMLENAVAVDIGTTTLAATSGDAGFQPAFPVVSRKNPQYIFGDDVISRIQKIDEDSKNLEKQRRLIVDAVNEMIIELPIDAEKIAFVSIAGNTVMQQIFHGIDPSALGKSPFQPTLFDYPVVSAKSLGLHRCPNASVFTLPVLGGFVGGDITAGILATRLFEHKAALLIDIGTNGELALAANGKIYVAASAAGPAFEGAGIECGTLAVRGAISHVKIDETLAIHCKTIGDAPAIGICGTGIIDAVAECLKCGFISKTGKLKNGPIELAPNVFLTQRDVRQVQLAAGAIKCGINLLLSETQTDISELERIFLAGGFGSYIRIESAQRIGLLPENATNIQVCGNTSLLGAAKYVSDAEARETARRFSIEHIDLSSCPNFASVFAESMLF